MTIDQARHAISIEAEARKLKRQFDKWVLLAKDHNSQAEIINVGDPVMYKKDQYHRMTVAIPDAVRRLAFRQWRKDLALKFNQCVRELNQLGVSHGMSLIQFSVATGEPV
ncbi:MAG: hypothetical protein VYC29_07115 [Pseudomonadota bacterium]|nr:hypothetical protein [Pseudomonadota bacterium]|tara:strand:- start:34133 stop:34462 length:330 start_codon:yes stop_codon:yes gene_type:complete